MKILLVAINARYIHSNPAVFSLKAAAELQPLPADTEIEIGEYTINHNTEDVRADIYRRHPDIIAISCYIWNITQVRILARDLVKLLPQAEIWLGGPEVTYHPEKMLAANPSVTGILIGPGEKTFSDLVRVWGGCGSRTLPETCLTSEEQSSRYAQIPGLIYRTEPYGEHWHETGGAQVMPLSEIPFWYEDLTGFTNRIIYYESSRGCPFSCSYCLSSIDKTLQFREPGQVCRELQFFLDRQVPQVKFIDRTFNCRESHALTIWRYIAEHDNGITNFHFEIAADLLTEAELGVLEGMRPGLVQLEIGVQSTNLETVHEIRRVMNLERVASHVKRINSWHNIHQHLDLIAGLPGEDYASFGRSFDEVYAMEPEQLQLGFLKVLKGAAMEELAENYELQYSEEPPYEVLSTRWLPYDDVLRLKEIEDVVEVYYNSGQFQETLPLLIQKVGRPFLFFEQLAAFRRREGYAAISSSRTDKYRVLLEFAREVDPSHEMMYRETLIEDCYLRENMKSRPDFGPQQIPADWELWKDFLQRECRDHRYLPEYGGKSYRDLLHLLHCEVMRETVSETELHIYSYQKRDPMNGNARILGIPYSEAEAYARRG